MDIFATLKMDKYIDSRFERLEKALNGLIDSVTKYSPSTTLGLELEMADNELSKGLEEGKRHMPRSPPRLQTLTATC